MGCVWWMTRASRAEVALGQQILLFSEVLERKARGNAAAGSSLQITGLDQVRFVHVLHGLAFFADGRGQGVHAHRSPSEFLDDGEQQLAIRSEEHTSELQSLAYLVCRLLLEKKKIQE